MRKLAILALTAAIGTTAPALAEVNQGPQFGPEHIGMVDKGPDFGPEYIGMSDREPDFAPEHIG